VPVFLVWFFEFPEQQVDGCFSYQPGRLSD
jgi:hypothetical protein